MDIYEGHVTALLGHNGAGKTTLIAMMTGMVPATEGNATVYGMDITDPIQMPEIRKLIGKLIRPTCCPHLSLSNNIVLSLIISVTSVGRLLHLLWQCNPYLTLSVCFPLLHCAQLL